MALNLCCKWLFWWLLLESWPACFPLHPRRPLYLLVSLPKTCLIMTVYVYITLSYLKRIKTDSALCHFPVSFLVCLRMSMLMKVPWHLGDEVQFFFWLQLLRAKNLLDRWSFFQLFPGYMEAGRRCYYRYRYTAKWQEMLVKATSLSQLLAMWLGWLT